MVAGVLALFVVSTMTQVVRGGSLDPPGVPGSTMLDLSELQPSWHQILPSNNGAGDGCSSTRFQCVMGDVAVLDKETGLVWQRTVAADSADVVSFTMCETMALGGRYGWHIPTVAEMRSLLDDSADHLPDGHPFVGVLTASPDIFWTNTRSTGVVFILNLDAPDQYPSDNGTGMYRRWCVRGGTAWDQRGG
jgi:hypothetical protein